MSLTAEQKGKIVTLRAAGLSFADIAAEVGCAKGSAVTYCHDSEAEEAIKAHRRELLEEVVSKHRLLLRDRLESLAGLAERVRGELDKRDLSAVPTPALVKLYTDLLRSIQEQEPVVNLAHHSVDLENLRPAFDTEDGLRVLFEK